MKRLVLIEMLFQFLVCILLKMANVVASAVDTDFFTGECLAAEFVAVRRDRLVSRAVFWPRDVSTR